MDAIRTFIALEIPAAILDQIAETQVRLTASLPGDIVRWTRPDSIHLTLKFLGNTPSDQTGLIVSTLGSAVATQPVFALEISGAGCFPNLRQPRVVWIGIQEDPAARPLRMLQRAVEAAIEPLGYPQEQRDFSPHLTLGRVARSGNPASRRQIGEVIRDARVGVLGRFDVKQVALIKSDLQPRGAVYTVLGRAQLKSRG